MLFSEIYGSYYQVVADILKEACENTLTKQKLTKIVQEKAFAESVLTIPNALKNEEWPLLQKDYQTPIRHSPSMPLTNLEKRWMKGLLLDPRIALFGPDSSGLDDVEPLYKPGTFVFFDQYTDGDPYTDPTYIEIFQTILSAIRDKRRIKVKFKSWAGVKHSPIVIPYKLEYSAKDDKFRVLSVGNRNAHIINLARIKSCTILEAYEESDFRLPKRKTETLTMLLTDERNALERALLHFSHFEKETLRLDDNHYQITLKYERDDVTELLIRVLSFGPVLKVLAPDSFVALIQDRLNRQAEFATRNADDLSVGGK